MLAEWCGARNGRVRVRAPLAISPAIEWTINNAMGSEPKLPAWVEISNNIIPVELGKLLAGQYSKPEDCLAAIKEQADKSAEPFRKG